jgi:hypothetical protein
MQAYIDRRLREKYRGKPTGPVTVKKEVATFRLIWNWAATQGHLAEHIRRAGYRVVGDSTMDLLSAEPDNWDLLCTNPPFSLKDKFLHRAYALGRPFALLLPIEALGGGGRNALFREHGVELIIPSKRIHFSDIACNFATAWFCWKIDLPAQLNFVEASWWTATL